MIESDLEDVGVQSTCSYAKQTLDVEFDEHQTDEKFIKEIVKKTGYQVVG